MHSANARRLSHPTNMTRNSPTTFSMRIRTRSTRRLVNIILLLLFVWFLLDTMGFFVTPGELQKVIKEEHVATLRHQFDTSITPSGMRTNLPRVQIHTRLALVAILTTPSKFSRRNLIRSTYVRFKPHNSVDFVFVFGNTTSPAELSLLAFENSTYGDLIYMDNVKENMDDGKTWHFFRTIADMFGSGDPVLQGGKMHKGEVVGVRERRLLPYHYVMKTDDDVFLHLPNLARRMQNLPRKRCYFGRVYPWIGFITGMGYLLSWDMVEHLAYEEWIVKDWKNGQEDSKVWGWVKDEATVITEDDEYYDEPISHEGWAHDYTPGTILIHRLKRTDWFLKANRHFFGDSLQPESRRLLAKINESAVEEEHWNY